MKIVAVLNEAEKNLAGSSGSPRLDAEVLLAYALKKDREFLFKNCDETPTPDEIKIFGELVVQRKTGKPVAYLTYGKEFYGLTFYVDENVLIPRPETEQVVDEVLNFGAEIPLRFPLRHGSIPPFAKGGLGEISLLDVGTGSGCVAVALAHHWPSLRVSACDISLEALKIAKQNAKDQRAKIQFYQSDLLADVSGEYEIVVANLPYVGEVENRIIDKNVEKFEPHLALFGGRDGLQLYERLLQQLAGWLVRPSLLILEIGWSQREAVTELVEKYLPGSRIECRKDLAGHDRIVKILNKGISDKVGSRHCEESRCRSGRRDNPADASSELFVGFSSVGSEIASFPVGHSQ